MHIFMGADGNQLPGIDGNHGAVKGVTWMEEILHQMVDLLETIGLVPVGWKKSTSDW